ncbi:imelysin family protein [Pseudomonas sp. NPDC078700]|uniref:imelysin family protein n=1 Tax=Pseudomonas sp. NPDC078700 TaxID=3364424 RepID=UPI0037CB7679
MYRSPLTLTLLSVLLSACTPSDPQQKVTAALADGVVLPAYSSWAEADQKLSASSQAFCSGKQDLPQAREAFVAAQSAWAGLQTILVGPMTEGNKAWQVQFWPDKKNLVARQVQTLLKNKPQLTPEDLAKSSVVVQGLTAYEYILYDESIDLTDDQQKKLYCPLITAIGEHQQKLSAEVLADWQAKDGVATEFKQFPNNRYAEAQEALADLLRSQVTAIDVLKKKLGAPLGRQSKGHPQPYQAEAWRSNASLSNIAATLASAERIWHGANQDGLQSLLGSDQDALKKRIDAAYVDTRQRLAALQRPLSELLKEEDSRIRLNEFYDSLNVLHRLHEGELASTLGIQLGFNANDGD